MPRAIVALGAAGLALVASTPALAQLLPPDGGLVQFNRFIAVRDRMTSGYEAKGLPVGTFTLSPSLETSAQYTDNVFALATNGGSDEYFQVAPQAVLQSNWQGRSLTASAGARLERYVDHPSENTDAVNATLNGTQEFGDSTRVRFIARYNQDRESRESQNAFSLTDRPIRFEQAGAALGVSQRFSNFLVSAEGGFTRYNYFDGTLNGARFDQQYRDADLAQGQIRAEIEQTPSLAYFVQGTFSDTTYRLKDTSGNGRDSKAYEVLAGARFELPIGARGEIGVGYLKSDYSGAQFRSFSGLGINSKVMLFPSELTTVTLTAQRAVNDSGLVASSGYVALSGGIQVDHELLRSLVLGAGIQYERDSFNGIDRRDGRFGVSASADYKLNRNLSLRLRYDRLDLTSDGADRYKAFSRNLVMLGIGVRV